MWCCCMVFEYDVSHGVEYRVLVWCPIMVFRVVYVGVGFLYHFLYGLLVCCFVWCLCVVSFLYVVFVVCFCVVFLYVVCVWCFGGVSL